MNTIRYPNTINKTTDRIDNGEIIIAQKVMVPNLILCTVLVPIAFTAVLVRSRLTRKVKYYNIHTRISYIYIIHRYI